MKVSKEAAPRFWRTEAWKIGWDRFPSNTHWKWGAHTGMGIKQRASHLEGWQSNTAFIVLMKGVSHQLSTEKGLVATCAKYHTQRKPSSLPRRAHTLNRPDKVAREHAFFLLTSQTKWFHGCLPLSHSTTLPTPKNTVRHCAGRKASQYIF